jgi:hypothetical protein
MKSVKHDKLQINQKKKKNPKKLVVNNVFHGNQKKILHEIKSPSQAGMHKIKQILLSETKLEAPETILFYT